MEKISPQYLSIVFQNAPDFNSAHMYIYIYIFFQNEKDNQKGISPHLSRKLLAFSYWKTQVKGTSAFPDPVSLVFLRFVCLCIFDRVELARYLLVMIMPYVNTCASKLTW